LAESWGLLVRQGNQALLEGRLRESERLAGQAARSAPGEVGPGLLAVAARREQGRAAEAEVQARELVAASHDSVDARVLLGAVLADLGRDSEAARQLDGLDIGSCPLGVAALAAEVAAVLHLPEESRALLARLGPRADEVVPEGGSLARHLGQLCHVLDRWDDAATHYERALRDNEAAGAPVFAAHTRRQYSALLRVRGEDGDWERAIPMLAGAADVYRRLAIDRLADESEAVLRRCHELDEDDPDLGDADAIGVFRPAPGGWKLSFAGQAGVVEETVGLGHVAALLAAEGRPVHVLDLVGGPAGVEDQARAEYRSRLAELDLDGGPLARAERDLVVAELDAPAAQDAGDRARRLVALRVRTSLDRVEPVLPALARHLRRSIRTGTFCIYDPERPQRWRMDG
jgi:tetratricopeptide (TPR) repeat protein